MYRTLAAFMFFTRLPLWRIADVPPKYFSKVVTLWPFVGWATGGITALVLYIASAVIPSLTAAVLAIGARTLLTGGLHEDGFADFCDGFGGGTSRERILDIMKDSHIGTYGVLGLIFYSVLWVTAVASLPVSIAVGVVIAADVWSKFCAAQIINFLPYSRKAEQAKSRTVYQPFTVAEWVLAFVVAASSSLLLQMQMLWAYLAPVIMMALLIVLMRNKIGGYTGDCCGASFVLCELSFLLTAIVL